MYITRAFGLWLIVLWVVSPLYAQHDETYPIVDTGQTYCFSDQHPIPCGQTFTGQDAQYQGRQPAYQDNGDGTITDLNTGLMWLQDAGEKTNYAAATEKLKSFQFAGYDDWRLPTIKELYSLVQFNGTDATTAPDQSASGLTPFIDTNYFVFEYGDTRNNQRIIDSQWLTSTIYQSTVMNNESCFFGFNFADGRIKCYPLQVRPNQAGYFARFVRGDTSYGINQFVDNGDGTVTDNATGLMWMQDDNGAGTIWEQALAYCESLELAGYADWRLPDIKSLHSIVDYDRSPDRTNSPAIDPIFNTSTITAETGMTDYPFFWSSTTLISYPNRVSEATYISFGRALGYMGKWMDVHGAGAQRSDQKTALTEPMPQGFGPQGDARRSANYVRCVRGGDAQPSRGDDPATFAPDVPKGRGGN